MIRIITASEYYENIKQSPPLHSGDPTLDSLIRGGFISGPVYFLYGPREVLSLTLMKTAVNSFKATIDGGYASHTVAYIDGENRFNPYLISKLAVSNNLDPSYVLKHTIVSRIFTWNQMVEVLHEKLSSLNENHLKIVLVAGINSLFEETAQPKNMSSKRVDYGFKHQFSLNSKPFQDLNLMFLGLNKIMKHNRPIIILTGTLHSKSQYRPSGGHLLSHFSGIIVGIHDSLRYIDYSLDQHPFLSNHIERYWKPSHLRQIPQKSGNFLKIAHNLTLDQYFEINH